MPRSAPSALLAACGLLMTAAKVLAGPAPAISPPPAIVGDPAHPEALAGAVQGAYDGGARRIVIRPGVYVLPAVGHTALTLKHWRDAVLSAYHVTLILTDLAWMHDGIDLQDCARVTVAGPLLSQTQVTAYQGRVVAVGRDADGRPYCDWRPDAGYPVPPAVEGKGFLGGDVNVVDARTRLLKVGCGDSYGVKDEALPGGAFRAHMGGADVGDRLVGRWGDAPFKIYVHDSRDCVVKDVTLERNGFAPLREEGGGGNHYLHCVWALGPRPGGATEDPLVTNAADGMHMTGSAPGPDIEGCVFRGVFLDDCIAIHGGFQTVRAVSGPVLTLKGGVGGVRVGGPVRISDTKGFFAQATATALKDNGDGTTTVTLDRDCGVPADAKLSNPQGDGAGYRIIGCRLGDTRSRGILAKADGGLIKGNVLENCGMSAVSLGPEYDWGEADYVQNVTVEGNVFRHNGGAGYGGAAILVHGDGAVGNRNIVLRDNRMTADYQGDMDIGWADGVSVVGNTLTVPTAWPPGVKPAAPVRLAHCGLVSLRGNIVRRAASSGSAPVVVGLAVTDLQHNDPSGIRAVRE